MKRGNPDQVARWRYREVRQRMRRWARVWLMLRWNGHEDRTAMNIRELALQEAIRARDWSSHLQGRRPSRATTAKGPTTPAEKAEVVA